MTNFAKRSASPRGANALFASTGFARFACLAALGLAASLPSAADAQNLPTGGSVTAGTAHIVTGPNNVTVTQGSASTAINWQGFSIGKGNSVVFVQPNSHAIALNRVTGADPSVILGNLSANGKVFLVNSNGILFGKSANVNVGGLVASTLDLSNADFLARRYKFAGRGGTVVNEGSITVDGGYVALLGASVSNHGVIQANLGTVILAAGEAITLDVAGDGLLNVAIDGGAVNALVQNGGLIRANGGTVLLTAEAAGALLHTVVNNTGVIEAQTLQNRSGVIKLIGDLQSGTMNMSGTLDASAPDGGNGGFIETSGATVNIASNSNITTVASTGVTGTWLIDPQDFTVSATGNISGPTLSALLVTNSVTITTQTGPDATSGGTPPKTTLNTAAPGNGDIFVNQAVSWTASSNTTTLTFNAARDVNVNAPITATNGNVVVCCGRDANINSAITTTNGSVLLSSGRNVNVGVLTITDGNLMICAGFDARISGAVTLTRGAAIASQGLGLRTGLTIITGNAGTGPGVAGGTLTLAGAPVTVTAASTVINYNPVSYAAPTNYAPRFVLTEGASLVQHMLVFPTVNRVEDGTTRAVLTGFNSNAASGLPAGVTLVAGPGASATFDTAGPGSNIGITYAGYSLAGANASQYALAVSCCNGPIRTTGTITAAPIITPPVVTPPVVTPPVVTPPVVTPPAVTPPVVEIPPEVVPPVVDVPVVAPPAIVPPVVELPVVMPPVTAPPPVTPPVVVTPAVTGPGAGIIVTGIPAPVYFVPAGLTLAVVGGGVLLPTPMATFQPAVVPALAPPRVFVAPTPRPTIRRVPKQDRN